jgi:predicted DNA-binding WGR domain protein
MRTKAGAEAIASMLGPGLAVTYWKLPAGVGLLDLDHEPKKLDLESKSGRELLGAHFAQLPAVTSARLGTVTVKSGAICVMRTMAYPEKAPRPTGDKPVVLTQGQGFEVGAAFPVENGVYEVHRDLLGDPKKGVLTEAGRLHVRVRLVRTNHAAAKATAKPAAKPAKGRVHLELSEGTSNKFWEAWVEGSTLYVRFGRIGTEGQTKPKAFKTPAAAAAERDALIASKRKKGYA